MMLNIDTVEKVLVELPGGLVFGGDFHKDLTIPFGTEDL